MTPKQKRFAKEYLIDMNATQAAIRCGYSKKTAGQQGDRLLKNVKIAQEIRKGQEKLGETIGASAEKIISELAKLAFGGKRDLIKVRSLELLAKHKGLLDIVQRQHEKEMAAKRTEELTDALDKLPVLAFFEQTEKPVTAH